MRKNNVYIPRLILALLMATLLYILIFNISYSVSYLTFQKVSSANNILKTYNTELESYLKEELCGQEVIQKSSEKLDDAGSKLSLLETRFGKQNMQVLEQKKIYTEILNNHKELTGKFVQECNLNTTIIIFVYSNEEKIEKESERIGIILSTLKNKYKEKIMVYSFDYNLNSSVIDELKEKHQIKTAPIIMLNNKSIYIKDIEDLESYLNK